jgi:hypothetical protein
MVAAAKYFLFLIGPVAVIAASPDRARLTQSVSATTASSPTEPDDTFNFGSTILSADPTIGNNYGPKDWDKVHCNNVDTCVRRKLALYFLLLTLPCHLNTTSRSFSFLHTAWVSDQVEFVEPFHTF